MASTSSAEASTTTAATVVDSSMTPPSTAPSSAVPSTVAVIDTGDVEGFAAGVIDVAGRELVVAVADSSPLRRRGLMGVVDLGDFDGMFFVMDGVVQTGFTMRNTLIPLHIAFFDEDRVLVDVLEMEPCEAEPCPTYVPEGGYRYAVEAPLGAFATLNNADSLTIKG